MLSIFKGIMGSCKALQTHLDRLQRHGEIHGTMDDAVMAAFASTLSDLGEDIYAVSLDAAFRSPVESEGIDSTGTGGVR